MSRFLRIIITLLVPLALVFAWAAGQQRNSEAIVQQLSSISDDLTELTLVSENLYKGKSKRNPDTTYYVAHVSKPSYGGPLEVAALVDSDKNILATTVLSSSDTDSYLRKVVGFGILEAFIDKPIDNIPEIDTVSGATLSSTAIIRGIERAIQQIGAAEFDMPGVEEVRPPATPEILKLAIICLLFIAAFIITTKKVKKKSKARTALLCCSVIVLGFWLGAQHSLATVVSLINGSWLKGMATYAALLCLVLTVVSFLLTRKNLFCTYICPFGAVQEGLGKITGSSAPVQQQWMVWIARSWVLLVLLVALYYQAPSYAMYEPFGKMFNFIGSGIIYTLTILVVLSSLLFKRPWCHLFCPTNMIISYLRFARKSFTPTPAAQKVQSPEERVK